MFANLRMQKVPNDLLMACTHPLYFSECDIAQPYRHSHYECQTVMLVCPLMTVVIKGEFLIWVTGLVE